MTTSLNASIASWCDALRLARAHPRDTLDPAHALLSEVRDALEALKPGLIIKGSTGRGPRWANVPWAALLDPRETTSAQDGRYVAVLVHGDDSGATVAIVWGTTRLRREQGARTRAALDARRARAAEDLPEVERLCAGGFVVGEVAGLGASSQLARDYERSCIAYKSFTTQELVQSALVEDAIQCAVDVYVDWLATD